MARSMKKDRNLLLYSKPESLADCLQFVWGFRWLVYDYNYDELRQVSSNSIHCLIYFSLPQVIWALKVKFPFSSLAYVNSLNHII